MVTDHFTQYASVHTLLNCRWPRQWLKVLWDNFIVHYGLPEKILCRPRRNFESELITNLCRLTGTKKLRTSLYYLQTNGQCERFNSTLINMLGMLPLESKNLTGKVVLECWCTHTTAPATLPWASAPTS